MNNLEGDPLAFLDVTEAYWRALRNQKHQPNKPGPRVVRMLGDGITAMDPKDLDYDVCVCGGTLGLMLATTLQKRGFKVCVLDKRLIEGRTQEWNISRGELKSLIETGLLSDEELDSCIVSNFNPIRVGFKGGPEVWVDDCLNLGVSPKLLLDLIKSKFVEAGGTLMENATFKAAEVTPGVGVKLKLMCHGAGIEDEPLGPGDVNRPNGLGKMPPHKAPVGAASTSSNGNSSSSSNSAPTSNGAPSTNGAAPAVATAAAAANVGGGGGRGTPKELGCRLLLDCMGHYSDIVKQVRGRAKPDGMVLVVGSCAEGVQAENNIHADLLYTLGDAQNDMQFFWEAFPAEGGKARTTYMFAYSDAEPARPNFEALLDRYFEDLVHYQGVPLSELRFKRVLFGGFPCYSNGPLQPKWDHIMQVGDASATQSPLSFGGFGAMMRHLGRLTRACDDALRCGTLSQPDLAAIHPYQPSLSASWLFQRSMSVGVGQLRKGHSAPLPANNANGSSSNSNGNGRSNNGLNGSSSSSNGTGSVQEARQQQWEELTVSMQGQSENSGTRGLAAMLEWTKLPANHVNEVLACNFDVMKVLGDRVLRPFLQDTIQLVPLSLSMVGMMAANPVAISRVLLQVGPRTLAGWFYHYFALVYYTAMHTLLTPVRAVVRGNNSGVINSSAPARSSPPLDDDPLVRAGYRFRRWLDALEFGSGQDYEYHPPQSIASPPAPLLAKQQQQQQQQQQQGGTVGTVSKKPEGVPKAVSRNGSTSTSNGSSSSSSSSRSKEADGAPTAAQRM